MSTPRRRLLIVDDEFNLVSAIRIFAEKHGYTVQTASDGRQAIRACEAHLPDAIVLDVVMPSCDGIEVVNWLVQRNFVGRLIIVTGGNPKFGEMARKIATERGGPPLNVTMMTKPVRLPLLMAAVGDASSK